MLNDADAIRRMAEVRYAKFQHLAFAIYGKIKAMRLAAYLH